MSPSAQSFSSYKREVKKRPELYWLLQSSHHRAWTNKNINIFKRTGCIILISHLLYTCSKLIFLIPSWKLYPVKIIKFVCPTLRRKTMDSFFVVLKGSLTSKQPNELLVQSSAPYVKNHLIETQTRNRRDILEPKINKTPISVWNYLIKILSEST